MSPDRIASIVVTVLLAVAAVGGFALLGSPAHQQRLAEDRRRVNDLQSIRNWLAVDDKAKKKGTPEVLPSTVPRWSSLDPIPTAPYDYHRIDERQYELCATFTEAAPNEYGSWAHPAGHACFRFDRTDQRGQPMLVTR